MRIAVIAIILLALAGCESVPTHSANAPTDTEISKAIREYFEALSKTIAEIDDGVMSPDIIGRVAVRRNMPLLERNFRIMLGEERANRLLWRIPTEEDELRAIELVLLLRKQRKAH